MSQLGLPFEYQELPEYFDIMNINDTTLQKNAFIEKLLKKYQAKEILDMTCGTGSQVFYLHNKGFQMVGSDLSKPLLKIAKQRAKKQKNTIRFIEGDVRKLKVGKFDAVITMFNAIGHLTKNGFSSALKNISENLHENGIYIFDILNLQVMNDKTVAKLSYHIHKQLRDTQFHFMQCSVINKNTGRLTSYDQYMIQKNAQKPDTFNNKFSLQLYTIKELRDLLKVHQFKIIAQHDIDGKPFVANKSLSILIVAQKI